MEGNQVGGSDARESVVRVPQRVLGKLPAQRATATVDTAVTDRREQQTSLSLGNVMVARGMKPYRRSRCITSLIL
jgi:hypothetical protein